SLRNSAICPPHSEIAASSRPRPSLVTRLEPTLMTSRRASRTLPLPGCAPGTTSRASASAAPASANVVLSVDRRGLTEVAGARCRGLIAVEANIGVGNVLGSRRVEIGADRQAQGFGPFPGECRDREHPLDRNGAAAPPPVALDELG